MRYSATLATYLAGRFLAWLLAALAFAAAAILPIDALELMRRAAGHPAMTLSDVAGMALLRLPGHLGTVLPLCVLLGAILAFMRLTRSRELVVTRASGVSVWQFLAPALGIAAATGLTGIAVLDPVAGLLQTRADSMEHRFAAPAPETVAVDASGIWMAEAGPAGRLVVSAAAADPQTASLRDVTVFRFDADERLTERVDAASASIADGAWELRDAVVTAPDGRTARRASFMLTTGIALDRLRDAEADPADLSIWRLPAAIAAQDRAGLSPAPYRLQLHARLALPLLLCGLVLVAAAVTLDPARRLRPAAIAAAGACAGLGILAFGDFAMALGAAGRLPVPLAAWAPAAVCLALGAGALLRFEDG